MMKLARIDVVLWISLFVDYIVARGPPVVISQVTQRQIARVGDTVRLSCPVEADPTPLLQWSKDGESINRSWERFKMLSLSLRIKNAEAEDTGRYQCQATNGFGHVTVDYVLIVLSANQSEPPPNQNPIPGEDPSPPRFTRPDLMQAAPIMRPVGNNARLYCPATGNPRPEITWFKDGQYFSQSQAERHDGGAESSWADYYDYYDNGDEQQNGGNDGRYTLRLADLREGDSGEYQCIVRNDYGEETFTYTLQVIAATAKPILIAPHPMNTTVSYGDMASFKCEVRSLEQPHIQWLKRVDGSVNMRTNSTIHVNGQEFVVLEAGEVLPRADGTYLNKLTIEHVTEKDEGMYICLGANNRGYNVRSAFLTVVPGYYEARDFESIPQDTSSLWDNRALPVIIGVPAGVILIIVAITICFIKRKQTRGSDSASSTGTTPPANHIVRVQRYGPPHHHAPQAANAKQTTGHHHIFGPPDKSFDHQYAALHPQPNYSLSQDTNSQQSRIAKTYSDKNSDISYQHPGHSSSHSSGTTPLPPLAPTPTLVQQHTHMHYYPPRT